MFVSYLPDQQFVMLQSSGKLDQVLILCHGMFLASARHVLILGYEPADLTVHPPPRTAEGGFIVFV